jgi:hypothetical protein
MSSYWPPPPKICGNWRNSSPFRSRSSPHEAERPAFAAMTAPENSNAGATTGGSSTQSANTGHSPTALERALRMHVLPPAFVFNRFRLATGDQRRQSLPRRALQMENLGYLSY